MLSGFDANIVAVCVEGCEVLCLPCASKRLGEPRCARVIAGLETRDGWGVPRPESQYQINEAAAENGCECNCWESEGEGIRHKPLGEFCKRCAEECCHDCGKRLDEHEEATTCV